MPTITNVHTEKVFEDELCTQLELNGWKVLTHPKNAPSYSRELALFAADLLAFVQDTQPTEWAKFKKWHNGQSEQMFVKRVPSAPVPATRRPPLAKAIARSSPCRLPRR